MHVFSTSRCFFLFRHISVFLYLLVYFYLSGHDRVLFSNIFSSGSLTGTSHGGGSSPNQSAWMDHFPGNRSDLCILWRNGIYVLYLIKICTWCNWSLSLFLTVINVPVWSIHMLSPLKSSFVYQCLAKISASCLKGDCPHTIMNNSAPKEYTVAGLLWYLLRQALLYLEEITIFCPLPLSCISTAFVYWSIKILQMIYCSYWLCLKGSL